MTDIPLETLRAAFARGGGKPEGCPSPERIWDAIGGALPGEDARSVFSHGLSCADCRAAIGLARTLRSEANLDPKPEVGLVPNAPSNVRSLPRRWVLGLGITAAAAVLAIALLPVVRPSEPESRAVMREQEQRAVNALSGAALPRDRFVLRWSGPVEARYTLTVTTRDLSLVHERAGLSGAEAQIPPEAISGLPSGEELVWTVDAQLPDGRHIISPAFLVKIE